MEDRTNQLKYMSTERMYEGILVEITDASVTIDIKGRLGQFMIPRRMIISADPLQLGQEVGFLLSYPEVLEAEPNQKYVEAIQSYKAKQAEIKAKYNPENN
ncbi:MULTISPECIES: CBO2463/CBO2479 domain-containing protein [Listeria]|uniref:CBO2463/CBO2479 domain-containing protein n=1 Tax=Listeria TaxID=1637 RepID=UPI0010BBD971|nr:MULTISPECIES: CBO2463/CBO2479 domain-containing protein [Listeria]EAC4616737.1 hypothetical protein [Listeria monocytogenes]EAC7083279.1 hypothetical protein [Listeria monocytogenes]EAD0622409.1 hypothetical protein [Listeria monocytogenes]EAD8589816.1 hypothetical protein [Listeria monocytogenes]EAD8593114.1 hypothetical protein [Listeria monocytogenes]